MNKVPRQKKQEQDSFIRSKNFKEVSYGYSKEQAMIEASRCIQCAKPGCVQKCPVNINIPKFIKEISDGNIKDALITIQETNSLPAVCGRVCPQENQCEGNCIIGIKGEPVAIGNLERFVADYIRENNLEPEAQTKDKKDIKVAIIGSGPSGLACASDLNKLGYKVTVFEAFHELGGVLVYGIPEFRLPKKIVSHEINNLQKAGVEFIKNQVIGKTYTIKELLEEENFKAIYIASGAGFPSLMKIPGEDLSGVYSSNEFLTRVNLMKAYKQETDTPIKIGKKVAVIGGGNTAMDSARAALRLGAQDVYIVYRRAEDQLPARREELMHAKEEGIQFRLLRSPLEYIGDQKQFVSHIIMDIMELGEPDESGRQRPISTGQTETLNVDMVIIAIGSQSNPIIKDSTPDLKTNQRGYIITDDEGRTSINGVYAGGDIVTGAATVIMAMGAGKQAAVTIDKDLNS